MSRNATPDELTHRYVSLTRRKGISVKESNKLKKAFNILIDPVSKDKYDKENPGRPVYSIPGDTERLSQYEQLPQLVQMALEIVRFFS